MNRFDKEIEELEAELKEKKIGRPKGKTKRTLENEGWKTNSRSPP